MLLSRLSVVTLMLSGVLWSLLGCSSKPLDNTSDWSPNRLLTEALEERKAGSFEKSVTLFERLEGRAAGTPLAQQAQLEKAYTHYKAGEAAQALAAIDRFMRLHPSSPALDYAFYLKGLVNFNDNLGLFGFIARQDLSERDQKAARESFEAFASLVQRFPDSRYASDAQLRMRYITNSLAQYEVHVARHYHARGAYLAAINRVQAALTAHHDAPALEEALHLLYLSYDALGMNDLRNDTLRVLKATYPNSPAPGTSVRRTDEPWWKLW